MSSSSIRSQLERKRAQRVAAEKHASTARSKESSRRSDATKARTSAAKATNDATRKSRLREAHRYENDANAAGKDAATWQSKASGYLNEEVRLQKQLSDAEAAERKAADRKRDQADAVSERRRAEQVAAANRETDRLRREMTTRFDTHEQAIAELRAPKQEALRVLILTASSHDDLRVGREQKRIQDAVRFASGRDHVKLDVRPAATGAGSGVPGERCRCGPRAAQPDRCRRQPSFDERLRKHGAGRRDQRVDARVTGRARRRHGAPGPSQRAPHIRSDEARRSAA